jgi:geranylgeranyl pyrophosphate synthase
MPPNYLHGEFSLLNTFIAPVYEDIGDVEELMRSQSKGNHPDLAAALDLIIQAGGKRIRPAITLLTGKMLGASKKRLVTLAAAIELLHTATLVHDDLIDGALLRRGNPTLNSQWSPGATVLTGDFIFARSAKLAADTDSIELMKIFSQTLSVIVNGEITQLFTNRCSVHRENYYQRIYAKTASLFETSATTAAILSAANAQTIESMRAYGYGVGMAFQIIDDILDFTGEQATVGKPVGSDLRQGIITLPTICFVEMYPENEDAQDLLNGNCLNDEQTARLVNTIRQNAAIQMAYKEACQHVQKAVINLESQPDGAEKTALKELAEYIITRQL